MRTSNTGFSATNPELGCPQPHSKDLFYADQTKFYQATSASYRVSRSRTCSRSWTSSWLPTRCLWSKAEQISSCVCLERL
jgi:hypothetical protein